MTTDRPSGAPTPVSDARRRAPILATTMALAALVLAACSGSAGTASPAASTSEPAPASPPVGSRPPTAVPGEGAVPQAVIDRAVADAADRAGVDPAEITVVSADTRTWPSGALGCPEPGYLYTDVLTPGYRIVVEAGGREYDYRASRRGQPDVRWCQRPPAGD